MGSRGSKSTGEQAAGNKSNHLDVPDGTTRSRGDTLRDRFGNFLSRGTFSTRRTIHEGEFGGSRLLDRAFFDWTGKPWFKPLDPLFFLITLTGLIVLVFYGLYDIIGRMNTFDNSLQGTTRSLATIAVAGVAAFVTQVFTYLIYHFLGAKFLVLTCWLIHTAFIALSFYFSLWSSAGISTLTFVFVWPFLFFKFQALSVANAHMRVWKQICGNCCAKGYGYNILSNIFLVNTLGYTFSLIWGTVFMGYIIATHTNFSYEDTNFTQINQGLIFLLMIMGFWAAETLKNVMYSLLGYICVIWSKNSEQFAICTDTSVRVWITNFGANSYAAFVLPILEPIHTFCYFFLASSVNKQRNKPDSCKWGCCYHCCQTIKHIALGVQEMTEYYNQKGLLMTACFGVPFVEGSEMTAYIPKEENPIMSYLTALVSIAGASFACFTASYWGDRDNVVWAWRDFLALVGFLEGYFLSGIAMTAMRGAADATDFLRHDDVKSYNRGRETFWLGPK